jgi:type IV pilus assembly protein PilC
MPLYKYTAITPDGQRRRETDYATDIGDLENRLSKDGLLLVRATRSRWKEFSSKIKRRDIITFTHDLSRALDAGVPLATALETLEAGWGGKPFTMVLRDLRRRIEAGDSFAKALSAHPKIFSNYMVGAVKAGETSGNLPYVLMNISQTLERIEELESKVKHALIYPSFVMMALFIVVGIYLFFVVPRFVEALKSAEFPIPSYMQFAYDLSIALKERWYIFPAGILGFIVLLILVKKNPKAKLLKDRLVLRFPLLKDISAKYYLARFASFMGLLLNAGLDMIRSLAVMQEVVGNSEIARRVSKVQYYVESGETLSTAMTEVGFDPLTLRMIKTGEMTGNLADEFQKVAEFFYNDVDRLLKKLLAVFEPLVIIFMGIFVGGIVASLFSSLYNVLGKIH